MKIISATILSFGLLFSALAIASQPQHRAIFTGFTPAVFENTAPDINREHRRTRRGSSTQTKTKNRRRRKKTTVHRDRQWLSALHNAQTETVTTGVQTEITSEQLSLFLEWQQQQDSEHTTQGNS